MVLEQCEDLGVLLSGEVDKDVVTLGQCRGEVGGCRYRAGVSVCITLSVLYITSLLRIIIQWSKWWCSIVEVE